MTSNVFREEKNTKSDAIFDVRPALAIASDWVNHGAHVAINGDIGRHVVYPSEDFVNYRFDAGGNIDVSDVTTVVGDASYRHQQVARGTPSNQGGIATPPLFEDIVNVRGEARYLADAILLDAKLNRDDITESGGDPAITGDGDRVETKVSFRTGYEFSPGTTAFIEPSYNTRVFARRIDSAGLIQGSSGFDVRAGLSWDASAATFAELGAGYLRQSYDEPSFNTIGGFSIDGKLIWNPTGLVTVTAGLTRRVDETTERGVSGILTTDGTLGLDYEYLYNLIVSLRFGYSLQNFQGIQRDDTVVTGSAGFEYAIGSKWYARLSYGMTRRSSTLAGVGFSDQTLSLAVGEHL